MNDDYWNEPLSLPPITHTDPSSPLNMTQESEPDFIYLKESNNLRRHFAHGNMQTGSAVIVGAFTGGVGGFYNGLRTTAGSSQNKHLRRTQLLNHVIKQGSATANTFGVVTLMYSVFEVLFKNYREKDDKLNSILAGTSTGILYKSSAGIRKCAVGGGVGLGCSALHVLFKMLWNKYGSNKEERL